MQFLQNISLDASTSLKMPATAAWYCEASSVEDVQEAAVFARDKDIDVLVLGGGSNLVLGSDVPGLVLANRVAGCEINTDQSVLGAGENWHDFVSKAVRKEIGGFENLALIPGNAGAAPMQNIGAYGVELRDRFISLQAVNLSNGELVTFDPDACQFGYRDSLFKQSRDWCITSITLHPSNELRLEYPGIRSYLDQHQLEPSHENIFRAVCDVRKSKLPDSASHPNAGSFFKNPIVSLHRGEEFSRRHPGAPAYIDSQGVKLSAAWLIDQAGLKGLREGEFSVSDQHALVIVRDGARGMAKQQGSSFEQLNRLIQRIKDKVLELFGVELEVEPTIYPD
ncbi:MAG: UDP-N-acetylmuramate dehydrogenase [Pseudomonadales bacterium]|nr:UDP-N-acetylmuramate dehydrogenase [Pseudomonadales bacterium]MBO6564494.1 UDP-N-acetylmuramate dehydrogenase [Pseudomonadales bacterium]MBO6595381.1 UDP-N-acetylmuramate dehydrogenase [Pseudomonadales bacterium]MBO6657793.1 UDP-N-acetylmuramate dehydrogenase [Pseudomonadales bacterium]MBO6701882.1 UDP-N-acetylmuramate dehydrogenase [Pseudomonadales bacterium]